MEDKQFQNAANYVKKLGDIDLKLAAPLRNDLKI